MAEAQTLTYDANEQAEGEFSAEEQEALEVGEKLAEQQNQLLAGKFKDAEDLEKGYIELQKKLGEPKEEAAKPEQPESKEEEKEEKTEQIDTSFLNTLWEEAKADNYTEDTLTKLSTLKQEEIASMYLQQRSEYESSIANQEKVTLTENNVKELKDIAGGEEKYTSMMKWATDNLSEKEVEMYDAVMDQGNPLASFFAIQALKYRFDDAIGVDGRMLQGKATTNKGDQFRSQAEVVRAMSDPQYEKDPAYRQDIYDKLERSNINL